MSIMCFRMSPSLKRGRRRLPSFDSSASLSSNDYGYNSRNRQLKFKEFRRLEDDDQRYSSPGGGRGGGYYQ